MKSFEDLELWNACRVFHKELSTFARTIPFEEKFKLIDQIIRSSKSMTANIVEGHGRYHYQENIRFCSQTHGYLMETLDHLICCLDEGYIDENKLTEFRKSYDYCLKLLNGYILYLKKKKQGN